MSQPEADVARSAAGKGVTAAAQSPLRNLPPYARSLLRISVPVMVTLATTRLSLKRIHDLAVGEAVKVGDKFGLRINSMVMPEEKFLAIRGKRTEKA